MALSESVEGGDSSGPEAGVDLERGESVERLKKLGTGKAEAAGDAWKVEPAKMGGASVAARGGLWWLAAGDDEVPWEVLVRLRPWFWLLREERCLEFVEVLGATRGADFF